MNKQYSEMKVVDGEYIPVPPISYPEENPFQRTLFPKHIKEIAFDEHYPYLNDSKWYRFNLLWGYYLVIHLLLRLKLRIQMGLRIKVKDVLKKYK